MKLANEVFGNKLRVRVNGLIYDGNSLLLLKHNIDGNTLWAPPGGGIEFGEPIKDALLREVKEETDLDIIPGEFLFFTEFINLPLHAIELFYKIESYTGVLKVGIEPEMEDYEMLTEAKFVDQNQLKSIPQAQLHMASKNCNNPIDLLDKRGQLK
jgi:8-oxo-dGTP diphosphatase